MFSLQRRLPCKDHKCNSVTMSFRLSRSRWIALLAALFVLVQALGLGHTAAHADEPHEHHGIACELATVAHVQVVLPAVPPAPFVPAPAAQPAIAPVSSPLWIRPPGRAPPPRSPPVSQQ